MISKIEFIFSFVKLGNEKLGGISLVVIHWFHLN